MNTNRNALESVERWTVSVIGRIEKNGQGRVAPSSQPRLGKFSLKITTLCARCSLSKNGDDFDSVPKK